MILNPLMKICMKMMRKKNTEGNWDRFKNIAFFTEYGDKEVIFHNNVKKIGEEAFVHNPNLKKVILPTGCEVDPGAFDEGVEIIYSDEL